MSQDQDDFATNLNCKQASLFELLEQRLSRRSAIRVSAAIGLLLAGKPSHVSATEHESAKMACDSNFDFKEIKHGHGEQDSLAQDHHSQILLRWGDPIFKNAPEFDLNNQTAASQLQQFGFNNDFIGYLKLETKDGQDARALLCINHEYSNYLMMFPDLPKANKVTLTKEQVDTLKASIGNTIVEIALQNNEWKVVLDSKFNRRLTPLASYFQLSGPVKGHDRVKTKTDPAGDSVIGTLNNCAGGMTPWGTFLSCEENFNYYFGGALKQGHAETTNHERYNVTGRENFNQWWRHDDRFNLSLEPNEPNRFGWVVEIDPMDPTSIPKKRTALGRFKHEGAEPVLAPDDRLVIYMGDDQRHEYLYKFVTRDKVDLQNLSANSDLLDHGILYVAKFYEEHLEWLPLQHDHGPLQTHFASQADVLIEPRRAADLLGATPMDRPEDVIPNKRLGKVYVLLTNNNRRKKVNFANPRASNVFGHIIEITESDGDFAGTKASWDILIKCGDPDNPAHHAQWHSATSDNGWFASPDNGVLDPSDRLWIATDQGSKSSLSGTNDGLWAVETEGLMKGASRMFYRVPDGAELCGPCFAEDGESLFAAVQHPGEGKKTTVKNPKTRWPDFDESLPPRPSIVAIRRNGGGRVG